MVFWILYILIIGIYLFTFLIHLSLGILPHMVDTLNKSQNMEGKSLL